MDRVVNRVVVVAEGDIALSKEQPQTVVSEYFVQEELDAVLEELSEVFLDNPGDCKIGKMSITVEPESGVIS